MLVSCSVELQAALENSNQFECEVGIWIGAWQVFKAHTVIFAPKGSTKVALMQWEICRDVIDIH